MVEFYTPSLLITEYYDSLISQIDIYTEETIKEYKEKGLTVKSTRDIFSWCGTKAYFYQKIDETYGVETINNPYEPPQNYSIDRNSILETQITDISKAEDYMNKVRQKSIDEIRKIKEENLEYYKANKKLFKVDRENLTEDTLEELKSQLFATKFCFLIKKEPLNIRKKGSKDKYGPVFNLHTVITDFYLRQSDIEYIRDFKINHPSTKLDLTFLIAYQAEEFIKETLDIDLNGYEIINIKQKTLLKIENIKVYAYSFKFNDTDLSFDKVIDFSAIKSLSLNVKLAKISDLSAFINLEYLSIDDVVLCQSPFQNLHKLIKLKIYDCDLSGFDFDSLNSLTALQIIEIMDSNISVSLKIDLNKLINLKWINLEFIKEQDEKTLELIADSYNQLTTVILENKTIDFSKEIDLPELKCLHISNVDLSQEISQQSFNGMSNLMKLILNKTNLQNVDFLDSYRLRNLEILDLSHNQIRVLRKRDFSKLKKLKKLYIQNNLIKELVPGVFEGLACLEDWKY